MKPRCWNSRLARVPLTLAALAVTALGAMESRATVKEASTGFRRILVPANDPTSWPREGEKFLPVEASEFEKWLAASDDPAATAVLTEAEYSARLVGTSLVGGRGKWHVELAGQDAALVMLGKPSIQIEHAAWRGGLNRESNGNGGDAKLGWWPTGDNGTMWYGMLVPQSGDVEFIWRTDRLRATALGTLELPLRLPPSASTRLRLQLPAGRRPTMASGIVVESPQQEGAAGEWVLAIDASAATQLRIESTRAATVEATPNVSTRRALRYDISPRGIDLFATLDIDAGNSDVKELSVTLGPGLKLVAATTNDEPLTWRVSRSAEGDGTTTAELELPTGETHGSLAVELQAWAPFDRGRSQQLPRLVIPNAFWAAGSIEVTVDESLELTSVRPIDCVQTRQQLASATSAAQHLAFDCTSPQGTIELTLNPRRSAAQVRSGTSLTIGNPNSDVRVVAEIDVKRGALHSLTADVRAGWTIESVETLPTDAIAEWYVEGEPSARTLEIQLRHAASARYPVTVIVTGNIRRPATLESQLDELTAIHWRGLDIKRELVGLAAVEPFQLETSGELPLVAVDGLTVADRRLFSFEVPERVVDVHTASANGKVRLAANQGTYDAEIQCEIMLGGTQLVEKCRVACLPQGSGIDHVLVHFSEPPAATPRWIDIASGESPVAERMPASDPRFGGLPEGGELWQISLRRKYARPVILEVTISSPWTKRQRVPIVSLPDAANQRGRILVGSVELESPSIAAEGMTPTPLPADDFSNHVAVDGQIEGETRAIYRYQPTRFYDGATGAKLWVGPAAAFENAPRLVAEYVKIESHVAANGSGRHHVQYDLANCGADRLVLTLAGGTSLDAARLNDSPLVDLAKDAAPSQIVVPLPERRRNVRLELELRGTHRPLNDVGQLASPLPASVLTILGGEWRVWLPDEFAATNGLADRESVGWRRRLFGPLARSQESDVFNPLDGQHWSMLWNRVNFAGPRAAVAAAASSGQPDRESLPKSWRSHEFCFLTEPPASITIVEPTATTAWSLATFIAVAIAASDRRVRLTHVMLLAIASGAAAMLVGDAYVPLATAAFLGAFLAMLWRWFVQPADSRRATIAIVALATASMVGAPSAARAAPATAATPTIHRVLVPVDDTGAPSGDKYFISDVFLRELLVASRSEPVGASYHIMQMRCRGEFVKSADQAGLEPANWNVSFDVEVLTREATVALPLVARDADWSEVASLDGIPVPIVWNERGDRATVVVGEPGNYRLTLPFDPHVDEAEGRRQIALSLPPISGAELRWTSPQPLSDFMIIGGAVVQRQETARTVVDGALDGSGRLTASWSDAEVGPMGNGVRRVRELALLRVEPSGVRTSVRYQLLSGGDWPAAIDLTFDNRWEFESGPLAAAESVQPLPNGRQLVRLRPPRGAVGPPEIALNFRLRGDSPFGRLRAPKLHMEGIPAAERALAVSCDPSLVCEASNQVPAAAAVMSQVAANWQDVADTAIPQFVFDAARLDSKWCLSIRPLVTPSPFRERLVVLAERQRLHVEYLATIEPKLADQFGWPLTVPAEFEVDMITAMSRGREVPLEWARSTPNRLNVFFGEQISETYELQLKGSLRVKRTGRQLVPRITAADRPLAAQTVSLYRMPNVLSEWQFPADVPRMESSTGEAAVPHADARFVRSHLLDPATADAARIVVEANEPVVDGASITSLVHRSGDWTATYRCKLRVASGILDEFRLQVPRGWTGPFVVTPTAKLNLRTPAEASRPATLSVSWPQSMQAGSELTFEISAPLASTAGQGVAVPRVEPVAVRDWASYVATPSIVNGEAATWILRDVEPVDMPLELVTESSDATATVFRVVNDRMSVILEPPSANGTAPAVRLAETRFDVDATGGRLTTTRFVVAPHGIGECTVELPTGEKLVRATLDEHPALMRADNPRSWRVQLASTSLPQTLEVVSRSTDAADGQQRLMEFQRPRLTHADRPLPVEINLWSLNHLRDDLPVVSGADEMSAAEQAMLRLDRLVGMSQATTRTLVESPVIDAYHWFASWSSQLLRSEAEARTIPIRAASNAAAIRVVQPADDPLATIVARCESWLQRMEEFFADAQLDVMRPLTEAAASDVPATAVSHSRRYYISAGGEDRLRIKFVEPGLPLGAERAVTIASIAAVALAVFWLSRSVIAIDWLQERPEATAFVLGLVAWLWLRPSVAGLALAAVSLALVLRRKKLER